MRNDEASFVLAANDKTVSSGSGDMNRTHAEIVLSTLVDPWRSLLPWPFVRRSDLRSSRSMRDEALNGYQKNASRNEQELSKLGNTKFHGLILDWLFALGGGTGASARDVRNPGMTWNLERRMRYQDNAVIVLLLIIYFLTLFFGMSFTYWQSVNYAPVEFYADPRYHTMVSPDGSIDSFIENFNQTPKSVQLQVTGFVPVQDTVDGNVRWQGQDYYVAFTFALDLSPWVVRMDTLEDRSGSQTLEHGLASDDVLQLRHYLAMNNNDLAIVDMEKNISWQDWEELATNIKARIRQCGFNGVIGIHRASTENVTIYKNKVWANFMHSRMTKVLCALSFIGWLAYVPYMWLRCRKTTIRSWFRVDVSISDYWDLIADKLSANGFEPQLPPDVARHMQAQAASQQFESEPQRFTIDDVFV